MRTRKEIEEDVAEKLNLNIVHHDVQILEVLLDIREFAEKIYMEI